MPCDNCNVARAKKCFNLGMQHAWEVLLTSLYSARAARAKAKKCSCDTCHAELLEHFGEEAQLTDLAEGSNAVALQAKCARRELGCKGLFKGKN